jgi:hypothetical protein
MLNKFKKLKKAAVSGAGDEKKGAQGCAPFC